MARELAQILQELDAVYQPQKDQYNKAITATDPTMQAEEQGLNQAKQDAFQGITDQANRRGMFYSGLPIAEQAKYTGTQFLPALANLRSRYAQQKFDLTNALNKVVQDQYTQAYGVRQHELDLEEQQREFDRRMAAEAAARAASGGGGGGYSFGGIGGGGGGTAGGGGGKPSLQQRAGGGFNFQDANGAGISAARYSQLTGIPFISLLQQMANAGDAGARSALGLVGNDYGYNRTKINSQAQVNLLRALGINASNYSAPAASQAYPGQNIPGVKTNLNVLRK